MISLSDFKIPETISFEGSRGTGKTTLISMLVDDLISEGYSVGINRWDSETSPEGLNALGTDKQNSPIHRTAVDIHTNWRNSFTFDKVQGFSSDDESLNLSLQKFILGIAELVRESKYLKQAREVADIIVLDRDLDTVIAYGASEIYLSNRDLFQTDSDKKSLVSLLWRITQSSLALAGRDCPALTIYLDSHQPEKVLDRGHQSKKGTKKEYEKDLLQVETQKIIDEFYSLSLELKEEVFPGSLSHTINVDGKSVDEVFGMIRVLLMKHSAKLYDSIAPIEIPTSLKISSLEDLIEVLSAFSSGAAFPSINECKTYGASNCVYSNASLVRYANFFNLGDFRFVEVSKSNLINDCPVHWCAVEFDTEGLCRVIDITPFSKNHIGDWEVYRNVGNGIVLQNDLYSELSFDSEDDVIIYMELANLVETSLDDEIVIPIGERLIKESSNTSKQVFSSIRFSRYLRKKGFLDKANEILKELINTFPKNIIVLREFAKVFVNDVPSDVLILFKSAWEIIEEAASSMPEREKFLKYYQPIKDSIES